MGSEDRGTAGPVAACPVCEGMDDVYVLFPGYSIYRCHRCTHAFYFSNSLGEEVSGVYGAGYFQGDEYFDYAAEKPALVKNFKDRLDCVLKYRSSGRLLEIGSAYGFFLELASAHFEAEGVEPVEEGARHAKQDLGLDVFFGEYMKRGLRPDTYDVVCMWDVLEHIVSPRDVISKVSRELRPGGILALTTGDISSFVARVRGHKWRLIHPPSHVHYFSAASARWLLEDAGFEILDITHPGNHRSLGAVIYNVFVNDLKSGSRGGPGPLEAAARTLSGITVYVNMRDIMAIVAAKGRS